MSSRQMGLNEGVHSHLSSCICRVGVVGGWCRYRGGVVQKGSTAVGGQGDSQEWGRWWRWDRGMHLRGIRALAAVSGADMTIGVMCTLRSAQATEKAVQLGLFLMCRLRFEEYQLTDSQQKPTRHGPTGHTPPLLNLTSGQKLTQWVWKYSTACVKVKTVFWTLHSLKSWKYV